VLIRTDRQEQFDVTTGELWVAMGRTDDFRSWWPWLRRFDAIGLAAGDRWTAVIQPPLPYRLELTIDLTEVEATAHIAAEVGGDIEGWARIDLEPNGDGCALHLASELAPTATFVQTVARLAPPLARFGHRWVLDTGLAGFRRHALRSQG
jgi:hypothetical protein